MITPVVRSIELPDRVWLEYVEHGDLTGIPMLLLHGVTDSWRSFERVLPHLPPRIWAFAISQRGHGDSARPAAGYRTRDFAADVAAFMDAVGLGSAVIVGHSMGSTHAMRFAIDHPGRTLGLVLAAAFACYRSNREAVAFWESAVSQLRDPIDPSFVREFQESTLAQSVPPVYLDTVVRDSLKVPARVWRAAFEGFFEDDFTTELDRITAPTLIVWGTQDSLCSRADQDTLLAAITGSRLVVYQHAGHAVHWEEPERFAADLAAFAERLGASKSSGRP
jgi:pimeloyl-ACP methyl ester carboxylesterase